MKRKILSFVVAFALLSQTALAATGDLRTFISGNPFYSAFADPSDGIFNYTNIGYTYGTLTKAVNEKVLSNITTEVKSSSTSYAKSVASNTFDCRISIAMSEVKKAFDTLYAYTPISITYQATDAGDAANVSNYMSAFESSTVTSASGEFNVYVTYSPGVFVPSLTGLTLKAKSSATDFDAPAPAIYTLGTPSNNTSTRTITVPIIINTDITELHDNPTYLGDLAVELTGLTISSDSTVTATMEGTTYIREAGDSADYAKIEYASNDSYDKNTANITYVGGGGGGGGSVSPVKPASSVVTNDGKTLNATVKENADGTYTVTIKSKPEEKPGFVENGWSQAPYSGGDPNYDGVTVIENVVPDANGNFVFHPRYVNVTVPSALEPETDENGNFLHKVYIQGYPDEEVKPNNNITREEVTAAFDRLLNTVYRETIATTEQDFPDVNDDRWSNDSIATMANGKYIVGDENGNFNPAKPITRAEFAVIASKFAPTDAEPAENYFTDIDEHWAKDYILKVAGQYWISGYTDGSFNPNAYITRAEAMTIINRMLVRYGDEDSDYARQWPDVNKTDWYYDSVIEATTYNVYERTANGWSETWVAPEIAEVVEEEAKEEADETATDEETEAEEDAEPETETETPAEE